MMNEDLPAGARLLAEKLRAALPDGEGIVRLADVAPEVPLPTVRRHLRRLREAGVLSASARGRAGMHIALGDHISPSSDHISTTPSDHISDQDHHEPEESRTATMKPMPLNRQARSAYSRQHAAQVKAFYTQAAPLINKVFPDGPPTLEDLTK